MVKHMVKMSSERLRKKLAVKKVKVRYIFPMYKTKSLQGTLEVRENYEDVCPITSSYCRVNVS